MVISNNKKKRRTPKRSAVVLPFRTSLRPLSARKMPAEILHMTLAAAKARAELDAYFEPPLERQDKAALNKAKAALVVHFEALGVRFDAEGYPVFSGAPCGDVSFDELVENAASAAMEFLLDLEEPFDMFFASDEFTDLGWRHGFLGGHREYGDGEHLLVPVVLTLDMDAMKLLAPNQIIDRNRTDPSLPPLERLAAIQRPKIWEQWRASRAKTATTP